MFSRPYSTDENAEAREPAGRAPLNRGRVENWRTFDHRPMSPGRAYEDYGSAT